jgi:hypothetical protein
MSELHTERDEPPERPRCRGGGRGQEGGIGVVAVILLSWPGICWEFTPYTTQARCRAT